MQQTKVLSISLQKYSIKDENMQIYECFSKSLYRSRNLSQPASAKMENRGQETQVLPNNPAELYPPDCTA